VLQEKSISQSSITLLMSAPSNFQGGPTARWAEGNSKLTMGFSFQNDFCNFLNIATYLPPIAIKKTLALQPAGAGNFLSVRIHSSTRAFVQRCLLDKKLSPKLAVRRANYRLTCLGN